MRTPHSALAARCHLAHSPLPDIPPRPGAWVGMAGQLKEFDALAKELVGCRSTTSPPARASARLSATAVVAPAPAPGQGCRPSGGADKGGGGGGRGRPQGRGGSEVLRQGARTLQQRSGTT